MRQLEQLSDVLGYTPPKLVNRPILLPYDDSWLEMEPLGRGLIVECIPSYRRKRVEKGNQTERGWAGHFICANDCRFRRNTLLTCGDVRIVVSTVGLMKNPRGEGFEEIGYNRYYETMAFYSKPDDTRYHDADVSREVEFDSPWSISLVDADDRANGMHEQVVKELTGKLIKGELVA